MPCTCLACHSPLVISHILIDTPGQIEIFTWSASGSIITDAIASSLPTCIAYIIDTPRTTAPATFMSNMLYACSILYKTKLPFILVFNKTDAQSHEFALEWMQDFEVFQEALQKRDREGRDGEPSYMNGLMNSMSLVLDEFYKNLRVGRHSTSCRLLPGHRRRPTIPRSVADTHPIVLPLGCRCVCDDGRWDGRLLQSGRRGTGGVRDVSRSCSTSPSATALTLIVSRLNFAAPLSDYRPELEKLSADRVSLRCSLIRPTARPVSPTLTPALSIVVSALQDAKKAAVAQESLDRLMKDMAVSPGSTAGNPNAASSKPSGSSSRLPGDDDDGIIRRVRYREGDGWAEDEDDGALWGDDSDEEIDRSESHLAFP